MSDMITDKETLLQMGEAGRGYLLELERQFVGQLLHTYAMIVEDTGQGHL